MNFSEAMVARLATYRRTLRQWEQDGRVRAYSHQIAEALHLTAAQVRRDLMQAECTGSPAHGYEIAALVERFDELLDPPEGDGIVLLGIGHLGHALLAYLMDRRPPLAIRRAFDRDPAKCGPDPTGLVVHPIEELEAQLRAQPLRVAVLAVPANEAQELADRLVALGVRSFVNFAPVPLRVPDGVFVENVDIAVALEKSVFYALRSSESELAPAAHGNGRHLRGTNGTNGNQEAGRQPSA